MNVYKRFLAVGAISALFAVAAGAFGAHGLRSSLSPEMLSVFETAVRYQMYHALGLVAVGILEPTVRGGLVRACGWCFVGGTILFSGSLYTLTLTDIRWVGMLTPLGGMTFIAGWGALAWSALGRAGKNRK